MKHGKALMIAATAGDSMPASLAAVSGGPSPPVSRSP